MATIVTRAGKGSALTHNEVDANFVNLNTDKVEKSGTDPVVISVNSTSDALRVTQVGSGNALVVEDSANPDSSPFVIDSSGRLLLSTNSAYATVAATTSVTPVLQVSGASISTTSVGAFAWNTNPYYTFNKSLGAAGVYTAVTSGTTLGAIQFNGSDGSAFVGSASIFGFADATATSGVVPGRLVFNTANSTGTITERMRIDSSGRVLVGITTTRTFDSGTSTVIPQVQQEGVDAATSSLSITRNSNSANAGGIFFGKTRGTVNGSATSVASGDQLGLLSFEGADGTNLIEAAIIRAEVDGTPGTNSMPGRLVFSTSDTATTGNPKERMRIDSAGCLVLSNDSNGIQFPATQSASTNANTLDDYEEGTFTPTVTGSTTAGTATYTVQIGRYTKIGDLVFFSIRLDYSGGTGTGNLQVSGLPFTSVTLTNNATAVSVRASNITFTGALKAAIASNSTVVALSNEVSNTALASTAYDDSGSILVAGSYKAA